MAVDRVSNQSPEPNYKKTLTAIGWHLILRMNHINEGKTTFASYDLIGLLNFSLFSMDRHPIKCGDVIRLQHMETKRNLHSHLFSSPLSNQQEVSCYGEEGAGDSGDHWKVVCSSGVWKRSENVKLQHVDTEAYLSASGKTFGR